MKVTVEQIRAAVKVLRANEIKGLIKLPMRGDIALTVGGVVFIPGLGYMHPYSFRDMAGEEAYQELLRRPRIVCEYDEEVENH